jgi:hypothetical protein
VPAYSASSIGFLLVDCSDGTSVVVAEETVSDTVVDANVDAGASVGVPGVTLLELLWWIA